MALFGFLYLSLPQIISFVSLLVILTFMLKAWRRTGNQGFLLLAVLAVIAELHYLALRFGGWLFPAIMTNAVAFHTWIAALLGIGGAVAWWMLYKQLGVRDVAVNRDEPAA
jgi:hypothetical protein